jgi:hypothetical protein
MTSLFAWLYRVTGCTWALRWYGIFSTLKEKP